MPQPLTILGSDQHRLTDSATGFEYRLDITYPAYYEVDPRENYPVIYWLDSNFTLPLATITTRYLSGIPGFEELPRCFVVGISFPDDNVLETSGLRRRDYTPTEDAAYIAKAQAENPLFFPTDPSSGNAAAFLRFLTAQVQPYIHATYPTDPANTLLHGHSFGGLFTLFALFHQPDSFAHYLASSPSIWWHDKVMYRRIETYAANHAAMKANLYFAAGSQEPSIVEGVGWLAEFLDEHPLEGLNYHYELFPRETHLSVMPTAAVHGLKYLLKFEV